MLVLLSYVLGGVTLVGIVACLALGLLKICDFIEESPSSARSVARTSTWAVIALSTIVTITDDLSFYFLLASWATHYAALYTLQETTWPFSTSLPLLILSLVSPIPAHTILVQHFRHGTSEPVLNRAPWPGGRPDWDNPERAESQVKTYGSGEALACFALCWLPALWIALGAITQNWSLPLAKGQARQQRSSKSM